MRIRQSLLGSADLCLRRAGYDLDPQYPRTASEASIRGTSYHGGLEHYYKLRRDLGEYIPITADLMDDIYAAVEQAFNEACVEYGDFNAWETSASECLELAKGMVYRYFIDGCEWDPGYRVLEVEACFDGLDAGGHELSGTADLLLQRISDGRFILDDHKTAGKRWDKTKHTVRKTNQPALYVHAFSRTLDVPEEAFEFLFSIINVKDQFERRDGTPTAADITAVLSKAEYVAWQLENVPLDRLPVNTQSNLCSEKWCSYWDHCAFGANLTRPEVAVSVSK